MKTIFILAGFIILFLSCAKHTNNDYSEKLYIPAYGNDSSVEIVAWNIETYPRTEDTDSVVADIIKFLDVDFFAIEEIMNEDAFNDLLDRLPGYAGMTTFEIDGFNAYHNVGFIYDTSVIKIDITETKLLFIGDSYAFPRPPLKVSATYSSENGTIDFCAVILHLKAMSSGNEDELRRKDAMNKLKNYINERPDSDEADYVLLGDWNSDYTQEDFLLTTFHEDADYNLLTYDFYDNPQKYKHNATYPSFDSVIDHIVITKSFEDQINIESIKTLRIDDYYSRYPDLVSDHRPVAFRFTIK